MAITAKDVMTLRQRTGLGMMECKQALEETSGDFEKATDLLRQRLGAKMAERSDRAAGEGCLAVAKSGNAVAMVQLVSETDFAARNDGFVDAANKIAALALKGPEGDVAVTDEMNKLVDGLRITIKENISVGKGVKLAGGTKAGSYIHHDRRKGVIIIAEGDFSDDLLTGICQHITASVPAPLAVDESGLPKEEVDRQRQAAIEEAKASGKPEQIAEKIAVGKLKKWVDEQTLLGQIYLREMDAKKPVRDYLPKGGKIIKFVRFAI